MGEEKKGITRKNSEKKLQLTTQIKAETEAVKETETETEKETEAVKETQTETVKETEKETEIDAVSQTKEEASTSLPSEKNSMTLFNPEVLSCYNFYYPGSETIPFPYPPPQEQNVSCPCTYCSKTCASTQDSQVNMPMVDQPISPFDGLNKPVVLSVTISVLVSLFTIYIFRG